MRDWFASLRPRLGLNANAPGRCRAGAGTPLTQGIERDPFFFGLPTALCCALSYRRRWHPVIMSVDTKEPVVHIYTHRPTHVYRWVTLPRAMLRRGT
jgi:hypothetical protein